MKTPTKEQLIARNAQLEQESTVQAFALSDLLSDHVKWFRKGHVLLGISRPTGASGGILVHRSNDNGKGFEFVGAYYFERWYAGIRAIDWSHHDEEGCALRNCADEVATYINQCNRP